MNLQPMGPTSYTATGETFRVFCVSCGDATESTKVLCDLDAKAGTFYCPECATITKEEGNE